MVLGCSVYHRTVGDQKKKKGILRRLTGQTERVFTATNALGIGIDALTIRVVIHVGILKELKQYSQESGRAGRDGQASEAIIMQANTTDRNDRRRREVGYNTEDVMKEFVAGERCRRAVLNEYIDGQFDRQGCEEEEQRCDVCRGITTRNPANNHAHDCLKSTKGCTRIATLMQVGPNHDCLTMIV
jgi:superfamily II DNA helicase RecQ